MSTESQLIKPFPSPKFKNKCNTCVYLGTYLRDRHACAGFSLEQEYDVYYCTNANRNHSIYGVAVYITRGGNWGNCEGYASKGRVSMDHEDWMLKNYYDIDRFLVFSPELEGYLYKKKIKLHPSFTRLSWDSHKKIKILAICALKTKKVPYEIMLMIIRQFAETMQIQGFISKGSRYENQK